MAVSLAKGQRVSLEKVAPGLTEVFIGLGWDVKATDTGYNFDLDSSLFMLGSNEKLISDNHFIFYNNLTSPDPDKSLQHMGDNLTGVGDGDDEVIKVNLNKVPSDVQKIVVTVTIHEAQQRSQNFGQVRNSYIRIYDNLTEKQIAKYELEEDASAETAIEFGKLYRKDGEWRFQAVGAGYKSGLQNFVDKFAA